MRHPLLSRLVPALAGAVGTALLILVGEAAVQGAVQVQLIQRHDADLGTLETAVGGRVPRAQVQQDLGVQYKTAWVLAYKIREAVSTAMHGARLGGMGTEVEIDGGYFGGYVKPANYKENRRDRRLAKNQNGKRKCVVVIRQRDGRTLPAAFPSASAAISFIKHLVAKGTALFSDESAAWSELHARYEVKRINHQLAYSDDGACTNEAEGFFSRMRRGGIGHHHRFAGVYPARYAQESAWREDHRRECNGTQVRQVVTLAMQARPSVDFCGYWQRGPSFQQRRSASQGQ